MPGNAASHMPNRRRSCVGDTAEQRQIRRRIDIVRQPGSETDECSGFSVWPERHDHRCIQKPERGIRLRTRGEGRAPSRSPRILGTTRNHGVFLPLLNFPDDLHIRRGRGHIPIVLQRETCSRPRKPGPETAARCLQASTQAPSAPVSRSGVLGVDVQTLARLEDDPHPRQTRDCHPMAPSGIQALLALEITHQASGTTTDPTRAHRVHQTHESRPSDLGGR